MRIISGSLKGRVIPNKKIEGTRPTMDRVKESLFAMISSYLEGSVFLDLFAGSGSIGVEAISNGAKKCYFVDKNKICTKEIDHVLKEFCIKEKAEVLTLDYKKALKHFAKENLQFDILFLDPPYKDRVYEEIMEKKKKNNLLKENSIIICEADNQLKEEYEGFSQIKAKKYGDKYISIYKRNRVM